MFLHVLANSLQTMLLLTIVPNIACHCFGFMTIFIKQPVLQCSNQCSMSHWLELIGVSFVLDNMRPGNVVALNLNGLLCATEYM